jgi:tetratricopeptide (TPR) repeat protein
VVAVLVAVVAARDKKPKREAGPKLSPILSVSVGGTFEQGETMSIRNTILVASICALGVFPSESLGETPGATGSRLFAGVDTYSKKITTNSAEAQQWFDQGLVLLYGFNHDEATRSFREAAARDPKAAMPWWGVAYAAGMNINDPEMTEERWQLAHEAAQQALALLDDESPLEHALVEAVAQRYTWPAPEEQRPYDQAYADAMGKVHERFAQDPDVGALYAEALMDLQPWDYWTVDLEPKGGTAHFISTIEGVLAAQPDHPGATHFYIHAMEAGPTPAKAVPYAENLEARAPGAGHLVHMPSHIYARVGRYADAADANVRAVAADRAYFADAPQPGMYFIYYAHNQHFLAYASMMEARYETAMKAARELEQDMPDEVLRSFGWLIEGIMPTNYHVMIRFGKWDDILAEPIPAEHRLVTRAVHYYARGIALSVLGRTGEARQETAKFKEAVDLVPEDWWVFNNKMHDVLPIALAMLEGETAYREGRLDEAWSALRRGIEAEDKLIYDEPPAWMLPVRHSLGALLMEAGEFAEAEKVYREDQEKHPGNGWTLLGLKQALEAQGRKEEGAQYAANLKTAWNRVEDRPTSSCLCAPRAKK